MLNYFEFDNFKYGLHYFIKHRMLDMLVGLL